MIVYANHDHNRNVHIITSIEGETVRSITYYDTPKGMKVIKDWSHELDELGCKSVDKYVNILVRGGFTEVEPIETSA